MTSRNDLDLEQKMNLIKEREHGLSHRELRDKFQVSVGAVSNILKRKNEYIKVLKRWWNTVKLMF